MNILSQLLPNDTWLTHLKYINNKLNIQGQSPSASALIGVMEASSLFSNARFVSPLTQDKKTGFERFQISVEVKALGVVDVK
jgi:general secretion pathway protein L